MVAGTAFVSPGLAQNGRAADSGKLLRWRLDVAMAKVTHLRHVMEDIFVSLPTYGIHMTSMRVRGKPLSLVTQVVLRAHGFESQQPQSHGTPAVALATCVAVGMVAMRLSSVTTSVSVRESLIGWQLR